jgi:hypothetical protein
MTTRYEMVRDTEARAYRRDELGRRSPLPLCLDLRNHSPDGVEWGYGGSGPAQLALALLVDATGDRDLATRLYQRFKDEVVARRSRPSWTITRDEVRGWVERATDRPPEFYLVLSKSSILNSGADWEVMGRADNLEEGRELREMYKREVAPLTYLMKASVVE